MIRTVSQGLGLPETLKPRVPEAHPGVNGRRGVRPQSRPPRSMRSALSATRPRRSPGCLLPATGMPCSTRRLGTDAGTDAGPQGNQVAGELILTPFDQSDR
jgi:hypothetical protein